MSNERKPDYLRQAETCLHLAGSVNDRDTRIQLREMAAAWLQLVETEPSPQVVGLNLSPRT